MFSSGFASTFADKLGTNYISSDEKMKDLLARCPTERLARIEAHSQIGKMDVIMDQLKA
jgi:hypothetical protein